MTNSFIIHEPQCQALLNVILTEKARNAKKYCRKRCRHKSVGEALVDKELPFISP